MEPVWNKKRNKMGIGRHSNQSGWANLPTDILLAIFSRLRADCLFKTAYSVCRSWRSVSRLNVFYQNKSLLFSVFWNVPIHQNHHLIELMKKILEELEVEPKCQTILLLELPWHFHLSDDHLIYIAQRLPNIIYLHMPYTTNRITPQGFTRAVLIWKGITRSIMGPLQSLDYIHVIKEIAGTCKFLELRGTTDRKPNMKHTLVLDEFTSPSISTHLSCNVQRLQFNRCLLYKSGLRNIMEKCNSLQAIIISESEHAIENSSSKRYHSYYSMQRLNPVFWCLLYLGNRFCNSAHPILNCLWPNENADVAES